MEKSVQLEEKNYKDWPFFYTIQVHAPTRTRQLKLWNELVLQYAQSKEAYSVGFDDLLESTVCVNAKINRRLSREGLRAVLKYMVSIETAEYVTEAQDRVFIFFKSLQGLAEGTYKWADRTGRIGSVEAVLDMCLEEEFKEEVFYKVPIEVLLKALRLLEKEGKAQVFYSDNTDSYGVKFFHI